jgi:hypothetical protein
MDFMAFDPFTKMVTTNDATLTTTEGKIKKINAMSFRDTLPDLPALRLRARFTEVADATTTADTRFRMVVDIFEGFDRPFLNVLF